MSGVELGLERKEQQLIMNSISGLRKDYCLLSFIVSLFLRMRETFVCL